MENIDIRETLLSLVRLGIGNTNVAYLPKDIDWDALEDLAAKQGLSAIVVDGIERLPESQRPPKEKLLEWIGEVIQGYEYRFKMYCKTIAEMANFYHNHGYKMMVLKGYACCLDWPKPEHRPCGDIDIWQFGEQEEADIVLVKEKNILIDKGHHHHTVFNWGEFTVENHYDFIDVHHRKSSSQLEIIFKYLGKDDTNSIEINGEKVYLPSVNLHALFLVYHTMLHFTSTGLSIRQILDWGFFVRAHKNDIDWAWLNEMIDKFYLKEFLNIINGICVEDLGFTPNIFYGVKFNPWVKERVLNDTFFPIFSGKEPSNILCRIRFRYLRWKSHDWKHKLCYNESMWSIFWRAVWSHILKPSSI